MVSNQQEQRRVGRPRKLRLEEVKVRIESWRRSIRASSGRKAMPRELWQAALLLAKSEAPAKIIRELGLNPSNYYQRLRQKNKSPRLLKPRKSGPSRKSRARVNFVELSAPRQLQGTATETRIEFVLEKAEGCKVRLLYPESQAKWLSSAIDQLLKAA